MITVMIKSWRNDEKVMTKRGQWWQNNDNDDNMWKKLSQNDDNDEKVMTVMTQWWQR